MTTDLHQLPANLPVPVDDGTCDHLPGAQVPSIRLASTRGRLVDLAEIAERLEWLGERGRVLEAGGER